MSWAMMKSHYQRGQKILKDDLKKNKKGKGIVLCLNSCSDLMWKNNLQYDWNYSYIKEQKNQLDSVYWNIIWTISSSLQTLLLKIAHLRRKKTSSVALVYQEK